MKIKQTKNLFIKKTKRVFLILVVLFTANLSAQTNVYDNIIAISPNHTYLKAAIDQQNLQSALRDPNSNLTVFAPTNAAFDNLATSLNTDIPGLLALTNLTDVLTYHVLGITVPSDSIKNGQITTPLNNANTLKLTKTSSGDVYVNQALVTTANLSADNGLVHVLDAVLLPSETVVDVALDDQTNFSTLIAAVVKAELLPALTNPFSSLTVFAPTNTAFTNALDALDITANDLLNSPELTDILTYHVLGSSVLSDSITNGQIVTPLNNANTLKLTKTSTGSVYINQALVTTANVGAENGVVHVLDAVLLPFETVADIALDDQTNFSTLIAAVVKAELLPALTNPFSSLTVFAPTNTAFTNALDALDITANDLLNSNDLTDILTYHVLGASVLSGVISNGQIVTPLNNANTLKLTKTSTGSVYINQALVTTANVGAENGVVHVLDAVLLPSETVIDVALDDQTNFSTLTSAVIKAELMPALTDPFKKYTVFAPTNTAFNNLALALSTDLNGILALPNLKDVLLYHVLDNKKLSTELTAGNILALNGKNLNITTSPSVKINDADVTTADISTDNGVVHVINKVLLAPTTNLNTVSENNIKLYPNPAQTLINVAGLENNKFEIVNIYGVTILNGNIDNQTIDISQLPQGNYTLKISSTENVFIANFVKI
ncbi:MAG: fasciclin domain-containing protein [Bacteroidota bacterium]|nr:fasciclin domain-containing protein [Bacteroidota bacterium]